jgi:hypothetical protein
VVGDEKFESGQGYRLAVVTTGGPTDLERFRREERKK